MRRWYTGCLIGLSWLGLPMLAKAEVPPDLPQDFRATLQTLDTAYASKDVEAVLHNYAPNCTFLLLTKDLRRTPLTKSDKAVGYKASLKFVDGPRERHDLTWQRQQLQEFFAPLSYEGRQYPLQEVKKMVPHFQKISLNRKGTELRMKVKRTFFLSFGKPQVIRDEVDEEVWIKNANGWLLKSRTIDRGLRGELIAIL